MACAERCSLSTLSPTSSPRRVKLGGTIQAVPTKTLECRASMKMSPFRLVRNVPLLRPEDPIPSCDDCAACSGTRQGCPSARGLDGTRRKLEPHIPHKREWDLLESATGAISIEVRMWTFLSRLDIHEDSRRLGIVTDSAVHVY